MSGAFLRGHSACLFCQMCQRKKEILDVKQEEKILAFVTALISYVSNEIKNHSQRDRARAVPGLLAAWRSRAEPRPCACSLCPLFGRAAIPKPAPATENNVVMKQLKKKKKQHQPHKILLYLFF